MSFAQSRPVRFLIALGVICLLGAVGLHLSMNTGTIVVRNGSPHALSQVSVTIQERRYVFADLAPGASARRWYFNTGQDSDYSFSASRADGTHLQHSNGYITNNFTPSVSFDITGTDDVEMQEK